MPPNDVTLLLCNRGPVLAALLDDPQDKRALVEEVGVSRSTVDRAIRDLEAAGLVERTDGAFAPTESGRLLYRAFDEFRSRADAIADAQAIFDELRTDEPEPLPLSILDRCQVRHSRPPARFEMIEEWIEMIDAADRIRALVPTVAYDRPRQTLYENVLDDDIVYEPIYGTDVAKLFVEQRHEERREMVASGNYHPFVCDVPPYALFLIERDGGMRIDISVYDDRGQLVGVVGSTDDDPVEWSERTYRRYRNRARSLTDAFR